MELTERNIDGFFAALKNKLIEELRTGAPIKIQTQDHYPEPRTVEIEGQIFPLDISEG